MITDTGQSLSGAFALSLQLVLSSLQSSAAKGRLCISQGVAVVAEVPGRGQAHRPGMGAVPEASAWAQRAPCTWVC